MRPALHLIASVMLALTSVLSVLAPGRFGPLIDGMVPGLASEAVAARVRPTEIATVSPISRWQPIGLNLLRPYVRGKIPVVLIHGLGATPDSWATLIGRLEANPMIQKRYQFWTFGYSSGEPILYSASLLRLALAEARAQFDPAKTDGAFDQTVLLGYSMGGILAKAMAQESQSVLWKQISDQPVEKLAGPAEACDALRQSFFFKPVPEVNRIIFIATPHRGSRVDQGALHWIASRLNQPLETLRTIHTALVASNPPEFFCETFRRGLESSVDQLAWEHPRLMALLNLRVNPVVAVHSIIAEVNDTPSEEGSDGVVSYESAHIDGVRSEVVVHAGHLCLANPQVIEECERILAENLSVAEAKRDATAVPPGVKSMKPLSAAKAALAPRAPAARLRGLPPAMASEA